MPIHAKSSWSAISAALMLAWSLSACQKAPPVHASAPYLSPRLRQAADRFLLKSEQLRTEKAGLGRQLKAELSAGHYDAAVKLLTTLDDTDRADPRYEFVYRDTLEAVGSCDAPDESMEYWLLRMQDALPRSAWSHVLLARYYAAMACHARGGGWARDVSEDQWHAMQNFDRRSYAEYQEANAIDPDLFPVYDGLLGIVNAAGDLQAVTALYRQSQRRLPNSYLLAADYMNALKPRWHGDYSLMNQFAVEMRKQVDKNPRFYDLGGYAFADQADMAYRDKDFVAAQQLYYRALGYGDYPSWLKWAGESASGAHDYSIGYAYYQRYLIYKPDDAEARERWHAFAPYCKTSTPVCSGTRGFPWGSELSADLEP